MALEAVVFPQDPFLNRDLYVMAGINGCAPLEFDPNAYHPPLLEKRDVNSSPPDECNHDPGAAPTVVDPQQQGLSGGLGGRRKRRRTKACKNMEEVENQRMTHIAVERNRRKQMNEYLAVLRSLMPPSYVQRVNPKSPSTT